MKLAVDSVLIRRLGIFLHVSESLNYSDSARQLGVTQSALTQAIQALENRLGFKLLRRSGNGLALTKRAASLLVQARLMVKQYNDGLAQLDNQASNANLSLTIGVTSPRTFYPLLAAFSDQYPEININIVSGNSAGVLKAAMALEVDLAQWGGPKAPREVISQLLGQQKLLAILPANHELASHPSLSFETLCQQTMLIRESGSDTRKLLMETVNNRKVDLASSIEIPTREGVFEAVAAGLGVTVSLHREMMFTPGTVAIPIDEGEIVSEDYLICSREAADLIAVKAFFENAATVVAADKESD